VAPDQKAGLGLAQRVRHRRQGLQEFLVELLLVVLVFEAPGAEHGGRRGAGHDP